MMDYRRDSMSKALEKTSIKDLVLREVWNAKDRLSASYNHDLKKLLELTREHQKSSDHEIVSFEDKQP
jgi:hypothetical protein